MVKKVFLWLGYSSLLFLSLVSCRYQGIQRPGSFDVFYTRPGETSDAENRIILFLERAERTIFMTMYNFNSQPIREALVKARETGVEVKIVGDLNESLSDGYSSLLLEGFDLVAGNTNGIQHNKFIVVDSKRVLTGTGNFTKSGLYFNDNNFIVMESLDLARWYEEEFFRMRSGFFARLKPAPFIDKTTMISGSKVSLYFSPTDSAQTVQRVVETIAQAKTSIHYMIFAFSHDEISSALIEAAGRGVKVYGIHDSNFVRGISQEAPRLYRASRLMPSSLAIRVDGNENYVSMGDYQSGSKMHCKTMLIDAGTDSGVTITGSFNWSQNAVQNNDENLLIIHNENIAESLLNQWKLAWLKSNSMKDLFPETFGTAAKTGDVQITEVAWYGEKNTREDSSQKFIELKNFSNKVIDLTNWTIAWKAHGVQNSFTIPDSYTSSFGGPFTLAPGELFLIYTHETGVLNDTFKPGRLLVQNAKISSSKTFAPFPGDPRLSLFDPTMKRIDSTGKMAPVYYSLEENKAVIRSQVRTSEGGPWRASTTPCADLCNSTTAMYASPGIDEPYATTLQFGPVLKKESGKITVQFSGDVSSCVNKTEYLVSGPGAPVIDQIYPGEVSNELIFELSGFMDSHNLYSISTDTPQQTPVLSLASLGNEIYIGGDKTLYYSNDSGVSFSPVTLAPYPLRVYDISFHLGTVYLATPEGVYISTSPGNFQKEIDSPLKIHHLVFTTNSRFVAGYSGLYRDVGSGFTKVVTDPVFSLAGKNNMVVVGTGQAVYYSNDEGNTFQTSTGLSGPVWDIEITDTRIIAATGSGIFFSDNSGVSFYKFTGVSNPDRARYRITSTTNRLYIASENNIAILESGLVTEVALPVFNGKMVFPEQMLAWANSLWVASSAGLFVSSNAGVTFSFTDQLCSGSFTHLPTGSVEFNGFSSQAPAKIELNEIMLQPTSGSQWLELFVSRGGTLTGTSLQYMHGYGENTIIEFPEVEVSAGQILLVYLDPESAHEFHGYSNLYYGSTSFISRYSNLALSDGILLLKTDNQWSDMLYYTNGDGHITSSLLNGEIRRLYADVSTHRFIAWNKVNPVSGFNDEKIQNIGIYITDVPPGFTIHKSLGSWIISTPTPGIH